MGVASFLRSARDFVSRKVFGDSHPTSENDVSLVDELRELDRERMMFEAIYPPIIVSHSTWRDLAPIQGPVYQKYWSEMIRDNQQLPEDGEVTVKTPTRDTKGRFVSKHPVKTPPSVKKQASMNQKTDWDNATAWNAAFSRTLTSTTLPTTVTKTDPIAPVAVKKNSFQFIPNLQTGGFKTVAPSNQVQLNPLPAFKFPRSYTPFRPVMSRNAYPLCCGAQVLIGFSGVANLEQLAKELAYHRQAAARGSIGVLSTIATLAQIEAIVGTAAARGVAARDVFTQVMIEGGFMPTGYSSNPNHNDQTHLYMFTSLIGARTIVPEDQTTWKDRSFQAHMTSASGDKYEHVQKGG